jgi:hypothetical protein
MSNRFLPELPEMTEGEFFWLVGLLEGEGSFMKGKPSSPNSPTIDLQMTDLDTIEKARQIMGSGKVFCFHRDPDRCKPAYRTSIGGEKAVILMKTLRPFMGERRKEQIDKAIEQYKLPSQRPYSEETVREIRELRRAGMSYGAITKQLKVKSLSTVRDICTGRRRKDVV